MPKALWRGLAAALLVAGACWAVSVGQGAHLLHFDAKAHLVVARRTVDSLTPGWTQLGAVWLPLPHLLNALPAQVDSLYVSGLAASALSFLFFAIGLGALSVAAWRGSDDGGAGLVALAVPACNPGWLYLQSTPLVEALFFGCVASTLAAVVLWERARARGAAWMAIAMGALACWVRYEAWPLVALALAWMALRAPAPERRRIASWGLGLGFVAPILAYGLHSWVATGVPFYAIDSENLTEPRGDVWHAVALLAGGLRDAFGWPLLLASVCAFAFVLRLVPRAALPSLAVAALAPLAVTLTAYLSGHPAKARYPLLVAPALALALAAATTGRRRLQGAVIVLATLQCLCVPWPLPVLREARRDHHDVEARQPVLAAFRQEYRGGHLLVSMGSLAPVLFELGQRGLPLRETVHEGNGDFWDYAVVDPAREVEWIMIARGDVLDRVRGVRASFPEGFAPRFRFGRVTIYERQGHDMTHLTAMGQPGG